MVMTFPDDPSTMIGRRIPKTLVTAGIALMLAAACGSTDTATASASATAAASTTATTHHRDAGMDNMDGMGSMDGMSSRGGSSMSAHLGAEPPPLASRLAAASTTQRAAAADLLARTRATLQAFESEPAARAAGFVPNPNGRRLIHYRNVAN